jgi:hypothetical protein
VQKACVITLMVFIAVTCVTLWVLYRDAVASDKRLVELTLQRDRAVQRAGQLASAAGIAQREADKLRQERDRLKNLYESLPPISDTPPRSMGEATLRLAQFKDRIVLLERRLRIADDEILALRKALEFQEQENDALRDALDLGDKRYDTLVKRTRRGKIRYGIGMSLACVGTGAIGYGIGRIM